MAASADTILVFEGSTSVEDVLSLSPYDGPIGENSVRSNCYNIFLPCGDMKEAAVEDTCRVFLKLVKPTDNQIISVRYGKLYLERHSNIPPSKFDSDFTVKNLKSKTFGKIGRRHFETEDLFASKALLEHFFRKNKCVHRSTTYRYNLQLECDNGTKLEYDQNFSLKAYYSKPWDDRSLVCMVKRKDPSHLDMRFVITNPDNADESSDKPAGMVVPRLERDGESLKVKDVVNPIKRIRFREVKVYEPTCTGVEGHKVEIKVTRCRMFFPREAGSTYFDPRDAKEEISLVYNMVGDRYQDGGLGWFVRKCFDFEHDMRPSDS